MAVYDLRTSLEKFFEMQKAENPPNSRYNGEERRLQYVTAKD